MDCQYCPFENPSLQLMIPRWREHYYLLRGPSFNSLGAGSWPVTRHVTASRDVTCPRHPQHHVSPRVTVSTTPPSLMYYYLNYSCLITHYTLHITHYTLQTFLVVTLWQVTSHPPPQRSKYPLDIQDSWADPHSDSVNSDQHCTFTPQEALVRANFLCVSNQDHYHYLHVIALNSIDT